MSIKGLGAIGSGINASRESIQNEVWALSLLIRTSGSIVSDDVKNALRKASLGMRGFSQNLSYKFREGLGRGEIMNSAPALVGACPCPPCVVGFSVVTTVATAIYHIKNGNVKSAFRALVPKKDSHC
ncbi:MAG: hypothetical protein KGH71_00755 [Candidatus Micrarchaeota archaeon]|nr:hypothetical protein [Candidatus Micrarchaeota archaeon]